MAGILAGKAALVTGSTSGIGLAYARALAGAGANVCLHGFGDLSAVQKVQDDLQSSHGIRTAYSDADLKQPAKIRDMVKKVCIGASGRLQQLVDGELG
jgi:3-hydroxybutyrate dehydrogenase